MPKPFSFGGVKLDVNAGDAVAVAEAEPELLKPEAEDPFRILVLSDFGGSQEFSKPLHVDRDNLNEVMRALGIQADLRLGSAGASLQLRFSALEDFEPDSLFAHCDLFRSLERSSRPVHPHKSAAVGSLLDAIVEEHDARSDRENLPAPAGPEHLEKLGVLMRAILHEPRFHALEAAWRSLNFLLRNIENDNLVKVYIADISKSRLETDLLESADFRAGDTYRAIVEGSVRTPGAEPWALIVGNYGFDPKISRDVDLLARVGMLARAAGAPFLAEAIRPPGEIQEGFEAWQALRQSSHASWLGLGMPRLLLRLPYGKDTATVESFDFEEMPDAPQHQAYLWGNPAFACAYLLALSFCELGWDFRPGLHREIGGLPLHIYKNAGVTRIQPCAELLLTESTCDELLDAGLMPLASVKDRDLVQLIRFQSLAEPPVALSGRWV